MESLPSEERLDDVREAFKIFEEKRRPQIAIDQETGSIMIDAFTISKGTKEVPSLGKPVKVLVYTLDVNVNGDVTVLHWSDVFSVVVEKAAAKWAEELVRQFFDQEATEAQARDYAEHPENYR